MIPAQQQPAAGPTVSSSTILTNADWLAGVDRYKAHWHPPKRFETQELLGSEKTLARARYEYVTTKAFTPVGLTEIVASRAYKPDGAFNDLRSANRGGSSSLDLVAQSLARMVDIPDEGTTAPEAEIWITPFVVQDCIRANSWLLRWLIGPEAEDQIVEAENWWIQMLRGGGANPHTRRLQEVVRRRRFEGRV